MRNSVWPNVLKMKLLFTTNKSNLILFHKFNKIFKKTIDWLDWRKCESLEVLIIIGDHNFFMSERIAGVSRENDGGLWWKAWGLQRKLLGVSTKQNYGFYYKNLEVSNEYLDISKEMAVEVSDNNLNGIWKFTSLPLPPVLADLVLAFIFLTSSSDN